MISLNKLYAIPILIIFILILCLNEHILFDLLFAKEEQLDRLMNFIKRHFEFKIGDIQGVCFEESLYSLNGDFLGLSIFYMQRPYYARWDYKMINEEPTSIIYNNGVLKIKKTNKVLRDSFLKKSLEGLMLSRLAMEVAVWYPLIFYYNVSNTKYCYNDNKRFFCLSTEYFYKDKKVIFKVYLKKSLIQILLYGLPYIIKEELICGDNKVVYYFLRSEGIDTSQIF